MKSLSVSTISRAEPEAAIATTFLGITHEPDDRTLVAAAQAGDATAMDALLRRHYGRVWAVCRRLMGNDADAADAAQDALIAITKGIGRFDGRSAFGTWAYRVATNACLDELRRRTRRPEPGLPEVEDVTFAGPPSLDDQVTDRLSIDDALRRLPATFRAAMVLRDIGQLEYAEIAETLGIPPGTVRSRIARGRAALARLLEPEHGAGREPVGNRDPSPQRPRRE